MRRRTPRDYPRTARLNTLVQQIVAEELERIDDERLAFVNVTSVVVDGDLSRAVVYFDHGRDDADLADIEAAFAALRPRLQRAVGAQTSFKRTPELRFEVDGVLRDARHIEDVLRGLERDDGSAGDGPDDAPADPS